jgi:potassium/hydrogen antiporter
MDPLESLTRITIVLFIGLVVGIISKKIRIPSILLLILTGAVLNNIYINGQKTFVFSNEFLISASILALVMIVFQGSSNFTYKDLDTYSESALKLALVFLVLNLLFLSIATSFIFGISNIILCLIFAAVMSGTDPGSVIALFHSKTNKITEILKFESVINTPIVVLLPFILLNLMELDSSVIASVGEYFYPFLQQIITGIGTGVVVGVIVFRSLKKFYSDRISPLTLITSALITYILSEKLGGNGVLAVTVVGIIFGNFTVKGKPELKEFSNILSNILEMLVFVLIGFLLPVAFEAGFIIKSIILFMLMLLLRFVAVQLIYMHDHVNVKERIFMSLNCAKGIAVAVVAFILSNFILKIPIVEDNVRTIIPLPLESIPGTSEIVNLMILFIIYSVIVSSIAARFSQHFIKLKVEE